jgi:predicted nucleic acid-binding protein
LSGELADVNVLLALAWPNHQFHRPARSWFGSRSGPWLTCALTELAFIRLSSNPAFTPHAKTPLEATLLLDAMTRHPDHAFLREQAPRNRRRLRGAPATRRLSAASPARQERARPARALSRRGAGVGIDVKSELPSVWRRCDTQVGARRYTSTGS